MNTNPADPAVAADSVAPTVPLDNLDFQLPPFPSTASQLVSELNEPEVKVSTVIELIECEPVIFSKVLNLANSPLFGASRPITTIGHAVVLLGMKSVSQLALAVSAGSMFQGKSEFNDIRTKTYFQSLAIATVARVISRQSRKTNPDEAFLCGVIHDVGKLILLDLGGAAYSELLNNTPSGNTIDGEQKLFGTTHPELGFRCGKTWGLSGAINQAIQSHHQPLADVTDPLSATIIEANILAHQWEIGFEATETDDFESYESELDEELCNELRATCAEQYAAIRDVCQS